MGIAVVVQAINHKEVETITGPLAQWLSDSVLDAPLGSMMRGIHKYADTMFNSYQLKFFLEELAGMTPKNDDESEMFDALRAAAEQAIRIQGYLWFSGD
ncbi:hypothetical protein [Nocardia pseudobrasiliensis]|uniref:Uncharacterized protein n=1 Tax=Nocardia pseudobrasiliensis TaxID=45979 RepID=A0A370I1C5_9NOCA|nr:hypothetical protein [Nocardia pseudobrasiliensis]RDI64548.1 hypothetical protein DFR76_108381 [Nocardia pseudobrasiliensis]